MSAVGLIINQRSNRALSVIDDLLYIARRVKGVRSFVLDGIAGLDNSLSALGRANIDTLILAGGDGTLQAAFTDSINMRRFDRAPDIVAVPCGMTNVIASDCGLRGAPAASLDRFLWRRNRGEVRRVTRPLMGVRIGLSRDPVYGFFLGAGAFHGAVKFSRREIQSKGAKRALALTLSIAGAIGKSAFGRRPEAAPLVADIRCDGAPYQGPQNLTVAMMSTLRRLVLGIYPFWGAGAAPLAVTTIAFPPKNLLAASPTVLRGRAAPWFGAAGYESWRTSAAELDFTGAFVFDGEFFEVPPGETVSIETSHAAGFLV